MFTVQIILSSVLGLTYKSFNRRCDNWIRSNVKMGHDHLQIVADQVLADCDRFDAKIIIILLNIMLELIRLDLCRFIS